MAKSWADQAADLGAAWQDAIDALARLEDAALAIGIRARKLGVTELADDARQAAQSASALRSLVERRPGLIRSIGHIADLLKAAGRI